MSFHSFVPVWGAGPVSPATRGTRRAIFACRGGHSELRLDCNALLFIVVLMFCLAISRPACGQVVPSGESDSYKLAVGATATGYSVQYGDRKMLGVAAIADLEVRNNIGIEGEAQWLRFHQTADERTSTYLIGPRYHRTFGRFSPYAKGLVGLGEFNFPYNLATGSYFVVAPGAGVDFRITPRIRFRVADFEYQYWPEFTYGAMSSYGISTGFRVRIF